MKIIKKTLYLVLIFVVGIVISLFPTREHAKAFDFNQNNLLSDGTFININDMSTGDIQNFLNQQGGFLKDYSEGGRSAAQIIYDAAHGHGEASGDWNGISINSSTGTVNPKVLLVTLQKEQSLITMTDRNEDALRAAMGYGCPDSGGCNSSYAGFTNQVEWGAWQLRYNYERASGRGFSDYQVGQTTSFNDWNGTHTVHFDNRATASLYRYTPHVYNGNYNFANLFDQWFTQQRYSASVAGQSGYASLWPGESSVFEVRLRNTGTQTWYQHVVRLGTNEARDRIPGFLREGGNPSGWLMGNRIMMQESSVAPGEVGTFRFFMTVPSWFNEGTYREHFRPVADGECWMNDLGIYWDITVKGEQDRYTYDVTGQNGHPTLKRGESHNFNLSIRNTGNATWRKYQVNLGTDRPHDRIPGFIREDVWNYLPSGWSYENRIYMQEDTVAPGETAHFSFWYTVPQGMSNGKYREYFRPVADGITWLPDKGIYWEIEVVD